MTSSANRSGYPAEQGYPRNEWYVAAFSSEVSHGAFLSRRLLDVPVVLYRTEAGEAVALYDRCPHRGLPLSMGKQVGDLVQCGYHGIQFGTDGRCTQIPSQPGTPASLAVPRYPVVEKWRWIWIWLGDAAKADPALIPDHEWLGLTREGYKGVEFSVRDMKANYQFLHDNLLDTSHLAFIHPGILDTGETARSKPWLEESGRVVRFGRDMPGMTYQGAMAKYFQVKDGVYHRRLVTETFVPSVTFAKQTLTDPEDPALAPTEYYAINALTPASKSVTHVFHAKVTSYAFDWQPRDFENTRIILDQDAVAIEAIQARYEEYGDTQELSLIADRAAMICRGMIRSLIERETATG